MVHVSSHDRSLAGNRTGLNQSVWRGRRDGCVVRLEGAAVGDRPASAIGILRDDLQLELFMRRQTGPRWFDNDSVKFWGITGSSWSSGGDPFGKEPVSFAINIEPCTTAVRYDPHRLLQKQALVRRGRRNSSSLGLVDQRVVVKI